MTYKEITVLMWKVLMLCLKLDVNLPVNKSKVRNTYHLEGAPAWGIEEEVVFFSINEEKDAFSRQVDSSYIAGKDTVFKRSTRTRVWKVDITVYGPTSCDTLNKIKNNLMSYNVKLLLSSGRFYLVPQQLPITRSPELFSGKWWDRWDYTVYFNEHYIIPDEDVGRIESVSISTTYNQ